MEARGLDVPRDGPTSVCARSSRSPLRRDRLPDPQRNPTRGRAGVERRGMSRACWRRNLYELAQEPEDVLAKAAEIEGHPDNVAAALFGGFAVCAADENGTLTSTPLDPPQGVEAVVVIPRGAGADGGPRGVPAEIPLADAVANISAAAEFVLGIQRSDLTLIGRGVSDRIHQPYRAHLYPRSMEIVEEAPRMGAIGATISGTTDGARLDLWQSTGEVMKALTEESGTGPRSAGYRSRPWARTCRSYDRRRSRCGRGLVPLDRLEGLRPLDRLRRLLRLGRVDRLGRVGVLGRLRGLGRVGHVVWRHWGRCLRAGSRRGSRRSRRQDAGLVSAGILLTCGAAIAGWAIYKRLREGAPRETSSNTFEATGRDNRSLRQAAGPPVRLPSGVLVSVFVLVVEGIVVRREAALLALVVGFRLLVMPLALRRARLLVVRNPALVGRARTGNAAPRPRQVTKTASFRVFNVTSSSPPSLFASHAEKRRGRPEGSPCLKSVE